MRLPHLGTTAWQRYRKLPIVIRARQLDEPMAVQTPEGEMRAHAGDFLIRGSNDELYLCKAEIFHRTHERITSRNLEKRVAGVAGKRRKTIGLDAGPASDGNIVLVLSRLAESIELNAAEALQLAARIAQACAEASMSSRRDPRRCESVGDRKGSRPAKVDASLAPDKRVMLRFHRIVEELELSDNDALSLATRLLCASVGAK